MASRFYLSFFTTILKPIIQIFVPDILSWFETGLSGFPGRSGYLLRRVWYSRRFKKCGQVHIGPNCEFVAPRAMTFSGNTSIGAHCYFNAEGGSISLGDRTCLNLGVHLNASCGGNIRIGAHCLIGPKVLFRTANHRFDRLDQLIQQQGHDCSDIVIEDDCWTGANAIILPGVRTGRGAVIGAGAVLIKVIPELGVAVGVPARVIKYRGEKRLL